MRAMIATMVLATAMVVTIALADKEATSKPAPTAESVLKAFAERAYAEVFPRTFKRQDSEITLLVSKIAAETVVPHKDVLIAAAAKELAELPKFTGDLNDGWETVATQPGTIIEQSKQSTVKLTSDVDALLLLRLWSPQKAAQMMLFHMFARHLGADEVGMRMMFFSMMPPTISAIDANPQQPVIAIETGPEIFVVKLKRTDKGYYTDKETQWLRRKTPTTAPARGD